jgi:hypothetical protein
MAYDEDHLAELANQLEQEFDWLDEELAERHGELEDDGAPWYRDDMWGHEEGDEYLDAQVELERPLGLHHLVEALFGDLWGRRIGYVVVQPKPKKPKKRRKKKAKKKRRRTKKKRVR